MLWTAVLAISVLAAGCRLTSDVGYANPSYAEQNQAVLEIVPHGTTRKQAVETLNSHGVQGSFGVSDSVYYCDVWEREGDTHWHLDVALFFDQSGRLYKVGPSRPEIGVVGSGALDDRRANSADGGTEPKDAADSARTPAGRSGPRTPFAEPAGLE